MPLNGSQGSSYKFMVSHLIHHSIAVFTLLVNDAGVGEGSKGRIHITLIVDFVEGHPVLDLVLVALKADDSKADKHIHQFAIAPAAILLDQMIGHFKVGQCHHRLNAVFQKFVKEVIIELQAFLIGL